MVKKKKKKTLLNFFFKKTKISEYSRGIDAVSQEEIEKERNLIDKLKQSLSSTD